MEDKLQDLKLIEPASPETLFHDAPLWPWIIAAILLLIIIPIVILILKRKKIQSRNPRLEAFIVAENALISLVAENARDAATHCSLIIRKYLSRVANDPALFETHEEFITKRDSLKSLTPECRNQTEQAFTHLAQLKYSPITADEDPAAIVSDSKSLLQSLHLAINR